MTTSGEHLDFFLESGTARERVARALAAFNCCQECAFEGGTEYLDAFGAEWLDEADVAIAALGLEQVGWMLPNGQLTTADPPWVLDVPVYRLAGET